MIAAYQVQAHVQARRSAGRGDDGAFIDEQDVRFDDHLRIQLGEPGRADPVGGGALAIEQAGGREHEGARADRRDGRTAVAGVAQRRQHRRRKGDQGILDARDDHGVGASKDVQSMRNAHVEGARADGPGPAADQHLVGLHPAREADAAEHLAGDAKVEGDEIMERQDGHPVHGSSPLQVRLAG